MIRPPLPRAAAIEGAAPMGNRAIVKFIVLAAASTLSLPSLTLGQAPAPPVATAQPPADPWPREVTINNALVLIYQPQINSWSGNVLDFRSAVALKPSASQAQTFGVVSGTARTEVDRGTRLVNQARPAIDF